MAAIRCSSPYARYLSPSKTPGSSITSELPVASAPLTQSAYKKTLPKGYVLSKLLCQKQSGVFGSKIITSHCLMFHSKHTGNFYSVKDSIQPVKSSVSNIISALNIEYPRIFKKKNNVESCATSRTSSNQESNVNSSTTDINVSKSETTSNSVKSVENIACTSEVEENNLSSIISNNNDHNKGKQGLQSSCLNNSDENGNQLDLSLPAKETVISEEQDTFENEPWKTAVGLDKKGSYDEQILEMNDSIQTFHNQHHDIPNGSQGMSAEDTPMGLPSEKQHSYVKAKLINSQNHLEDTSDISHSSVDSHPSTNSQHKSLNVLETKQNIDQKTTKDDVTADHPSHGLNPSGSESGRSGNKKSVIDHVKGMFGSMPSMPSMPNMPSMPSMPNISYLTVKSKVETEQSRPVIPRSIINQRTRNLVKTLKCADSSSSRLLRLTHLGKHIQTYPECKATAVQEGVITILLQLRDYGGNHALREQSMETLALMGYVAPVRGRGVRILSLDGGGTRGLISIALMAHIEKICNCRIHEVFDYIGGVSTGSLIAAIVGIHKRPLEEAVHLYKHFSCQIFNQRTYTSVKNYAKSQAKYEAETWERILQENIGYTTFLETTRDPDMPKVCAISCVVNRIKATNYIFRNYTYLPGRESKYPGSIDYSLWEAIRASSAAPFYFPTKQLGQWIHQDGGLLTNNPTAIALHECRQLWPGEKVQCVVSLGTGRYEPLLEPKRKTQTIFQQSLKFVESATDTEAVHTMLQDLLPNTYFRFNPFVLENLGLDETNTDKWDLMTQETDKYCQENDLKLRAAADLLLKPRTFRQRSVDNIGLYRERDLPRLKNWATNATLRAKKNM